MILLPPQQNRISEINDCNTQSPLFDASIGMDKIILFPYSILIS